MTVRTISQLPALGEKELSGDCLFEISKPQEDDKYTSKKISYETLNNKIQDDSKSFLYKTYKLNEDVDFSKIRSDINTLNGYFDVNSSNTAIFAKTPCVKNASTKLATETWVKTKINSENASVIAPDSIKSNTYNLTFNNSKTQSEAITLEANQTGNLVVYGWMADDGSDFHPSKCWVGLKAKLKNEWILLSVQPWILGTYRSQLQYVSFNVPVSTGDSGMQIRIDCGFDVGDSSSGSQNTDSSLADSVANKFIAYILKRSPTS